MTVNQNNRIDDDDEDFLNREEEQVTAIPKEEVNGLMQKIRKLNKYSLEETKTRNILIVGKTRSGKSTAVGVLKDPCYLPKNMSIFSDTVDPKFASFSLDNKNDSTKYTINVIDTPGLKEVTVIGKEARTDQAIMNTINYCLKNEITKVNVLLIFISFELGVTSDDVDSFRQYLESFGHNAISICMCITRAEEKTPAWRQNIVSELEKHPYFAEVLKRENVFITFIGCIEPTRFTTLSSVSDLQRLYTTVYKLRESLLKIIFDAENQVKLIDLPISSGLQTKVLNIFNSQFSILTRLEKVNDFGTAEIQLKIDEFAANVAEMLNYEGLLYDENNNKQFQLMKEQLRAILPRLNDFDAERIKGKLIL